MKNRCKDEVAEGTTNLADLAVHSPSTWRLKEHRNTQHWYRGLWAHSRGSWRRGGGVCYNSLGIIVGHLHASIILHKVTQWYAKGSRGREKLLLLGALVCKMTAWKIYPPWCMCTPWALLQSTIQTKYIWQEYLIRRQNIISNAQLDTEKVL